VKLIEVIHSHCVGCRLCEMICSLVHEQECSTTKSRIKIIRDEEFGNNWVSVCLQCEHAECMESCNYGALRRNSQTGSMVVDDQLCNGCEACVAACPLGSVTLDKERRVVFMCDLCGGDPECIKVCSREALIEKDTEPAAQERKSLLAETSKALSQVGR
jgi:anaerobic carbon-monoxide dehydrogenase iron sulfur subunit